MVRIEAAHRRNAGATQTAGTVVENGEFWHGVSGRLASLWYLIPGAEWRATRER